MEKTNDKQEIVSATLKTDKVKREKDDKKTRRGYALFFGNRKGQGILLKFMRQSWFVGSVCILGLLQACAIVNPKGAAFTPDQTITGALAPAGEKLDDERLEKDARIIRDQLAQMAFVSEVDQHGLMWENDDTGSRGVISQVQSTQRDNRNCRIFKTTRESFDGVMIYEGQACETPSGWILSRFEAQ